LTKDGKEKIKDYKGGLLSIVTVLLFVGCVAFKALNLDYGTYAEKVNGPRQL